MGILQSLSYSSQPILLSFCLSHDDASGNQQKNRTGLQGNHACLRRNVGEKAEWKTGTRKFRYIRGMAHKARRMASSEVTDCAQIFVITTPESRTGVCSAASLDHEAVQLSEQLNECVTLVGFCRLQKLCSGITENSPQGRRHFPALLQPGVQFDQ